MDDKARSYRTLILISFAVGLGSYTGTYMRIPIIPLYARSLEVGTIDIGIINSLFMLAAGGLSIPLGIMSDLIGRKRLILGGLFLAAVSSFLLAFSRTSPQMMAVCVLAGIGLGAFGPTMMSFVADFSPQTHLGRSYGLYTMAIYGGMTLGPAIGGGIANMLGYQRVFTISGTLISVVLLIALLSFPQAGQTHIKASAARDSSKIILGLAGNYPFLACCMVTLFSCLGLGVFITFEPLHAADQGIGAGKTGLIFGTQALVNAVSRIPFGYVSDLVSHRSTLVLTGLLAYAVSVCGLGLSTSLAMFLVSAAGMGVGMGIAFTAVGALISEVVPVGSRGLAMGGYTSCIYMGMMLSSLIMGVVAAKFGFRASFLITAGLIAIGALAFGIIFKSVSASVAAPRPKTPAGQS